MRKWQEMNALTLAYLGDAVYELWVRTHLMELGHEKVRELHKQAISYVRASTQARLLHALFSELDEVEQQVVLRGRNAKGGHPKNVDVVTYRHATAFESLVGYWQLNGQLDRMQWAFSKVDGMLQDDLSQETENRKDESGKDESGSYSVHT
ncbi:MAG TPA: ribonuclease III domain-containing protein [Desulfosporosinus sp.]